MTNKSYKLIDDFIHLIFSEKETKKMKNTENNKTNLSNWNFTIGNTNITIKKMITVKLKNGKTFIFDADEVEETGHKLYFYKNFQNKKGKQCSFSLGEVLNKEKTKDNWEDQAIKLYQQDRVKACAKSNSDK